MTCVAASVYNMATKPPTKPKPEYGQRLEARRAVLRKSLDNIADETNGFLYKQLLYRLENGRKRPETLNMEQIAYLARALEWSPGQLASALNVVLPAQLQDKPTWGESGPTIRTTAGHRLRKLREEMGLERPLVADLLQGGVTARRLANLEDKEDVWERITETEVNGLAFVYQMSVPQFLEAVNGTRFPTIPNIFNDEAIIEKSNLNHGIKLIPEYNMAGMGEGGDDGDILGYVDIPEGWNGDHVAYRVFGDSMSPEIRDGATVIVKLQSAVAPGNDIICWTPDNGMLCKHLDRIEEGLHVLTSVNREYKPIWAKFIKIYGVIVQSRNPHRVINGKH